jgi:hypothetical protein
VGQKAIEEKGKGMKEVVDPSGQFSLYRHLYTKFAINHHHYCFEEAGI